ncbi:hypothetical protein PAMA_013934 [Pampus argenteus]
MGKHRPHSSVIAEDTSHLTTSDYLGVFRRLSRRDLGSSVKPSASAHQTGLIRAAHLAGAEALDGVQRKFKGDSTLQKPKRKNSSEAIASVMSDDIKRSPQRCTRCLNLIVINRSSCSFALVQMATAGRRALGELQWESKGEEEMAEDDGERERERETTGAAV